jgi:signal transduction histidine kinase
MDIFVLAIAIGIVALSFLLLVVWGLWLNRRAVVRLAQAEALCKQFEEREALIRLITGQIRSTLDLSIIMQTTVREMRRFLHTDRVVLYQFTDSCQGKIVVEEVLEPWPSVLGKMRQDHGFVEELAQLYQQDWDRVINQGLEAGLEVDHVQFFQQMQVQTNLSVPIVIGKKLWGVLLAYEYKAPRVWQPTEVNLCQQMGNQLAIAINQAELHDQTRRDTAATIAQSQQLNEVLHNLQQAQTQLIQAEKMSSLGRMVAGVAHEINNPVTFVCGNLNYLTRYTQDLLDLCHLYQETYPNPSAQIRDYLEKIDLNFIAADLPKLLASMKVGADRIRQIIHSLKTFSRLDEADFKPINIHEEIDSTLMILQNRLKSHAGQPEIQVTKCYGELPLVECCAGQLSQVFMNILSNAIDALRKWSEDTLEMAPRTRQISITTESLNNGWVEIRIADNGFGMTEEVKNRLFDPFYTTKPTGEGTGLGMYISYQVVQQHGGVLECWSQPAQGAEFFIQIPAQQQHQHVKTEQQQEQQTTEKWSSGSICYF